MNKDHWLNRFTQALDGMVLRHRPGHLSDEEAQPADWPDNTDMQEAPDLNENTDGQEAGDWHAKMDWQDMLDTASILVDMDFSTESQIRQTLKDKLLWQIGQNNSKVDLVLPDDELDRVAGGLHSAEPEGARFGCSLCRCRLDRKLITTKNCPACGHPRDAH